MLSLTTSPLFAGMKLELARLKHSEDAAYGYGRRVGRRTSCLPGTRTEILKTLDTWLLDPQEFRIFWLNGMAGTGKSTIADSLYATARDHGAHVAGFFCSRESNTASVIHHIIPHLAYQLAYAHPGYCSALVTFLHREAHPEQLSFEEQMKKLILEPLAATSDTLTSFTFFVVDALDECRGKNSRDHVRVFIDLLCLHVEDFRRARVKFFVSSRPALEISFRFKSDTAQEHHDKIILHDAPREDVHHDIEMYVRSQLTKITVEKDSSFVFFDAHVNAIVNAAVPLFIFASTACAQISGRNTRVRVSHKVQLERIVARLRADIAQVSGRGGNAGQMMATLGRLYRTILEDAFVGDDSTRFGDTEQAEEAKIVVASVLVLFEPLGLDAMARLLGKTSGDIRQLLYDLHSVLSVPDEDTRAIRAFHASFHGYLTSPERVHETPSFHVSTSEHHTKLALACLKLLVDVLIYDNICDLRVGEDEGLTNYRDRIRDSNIRDALPAIQYACVYWGHHLSEASSTSDPVLKQALDSFSSTRLFRWIEMLVIIDQLEKAVPMIAVVCKSLPGSYIFDLLRTALICIHRRSNLQTLWTFSPISSEWCMRLTMSSMNHRSRSTCPGFLSFLGSVLYSLNMTSPGSLRLQREPSMSCMV